MVFSHWFLVTNLSNGKNASEVKSLFECCNETKFDHLLTVKVGQSQEIFSICFPPQKTDKITIPRTFNLSRKNEGHFEDRSKPKIPSEIAPPARNLPARSTLCFFEGIPSLSSIFILTISIVSVGSTYTLMTFPVRNLTKICISIFFFDKKYSLDRKLEVNGFDRRKTVP